MERLSALGCNYISWMTPLLEISSTCWPRPHLRLYWLSKGSR
jgi:hypothetical protein